MSRETTARLLITCPDRRGLVAAVTGFLHSHGVNITALDQYTTAPEGGRFFMRTEFETPHLDVSREGLERSFGEVVAEVKVFVPAKGTCHLICRRRRHEVHLG